MYRLDQEKWSNCRAVPLRWWRDEGRNWGGRSVVQYIVSGLFWYFQSSWWVCFPFSLSRRGFSKYCWIDRGQLGQSWFLFKRRGGCFQYLPGFCVQTNISFQVWMEGFGEIFFSLVFRSNTGKW